MHRHSDWRWPDILGLYSFEGKLCHSASYDNTVGLEGKRVAVIIMASSGIQATSEIAGKVSQLYTSIRSPTRITVGFAQNWAAQMERILKVSYLVKTIESRL